MRLLIQDDFASRGRSSPAHEWDPDASDKNLDLEVRGDFGPDPDAPTRSARRIEPRSTNRKKVSYGK